AVPEEGAAGAGARRVDGKDADGAPGGAPPLDEHRGEGRLSRAVRAGDADDVPAPLPFSGEAAGENRHEARRRDPRVGPAIVEEVQGLGDGRAITPAYRVGEGSGVRRGGLAAGDRPRVHASCPRGPRPWALRTTSMISPMMRFMSASLGV